MGILKRIFWVMVAVGILCAANAQAAERIINGRRHSGSDYIDVTKTVSAGSYISSEIYEIGTPGTLGFGVGAYEGALPSGFSELSGSKDIRSPNYGNYQYVDGSIMVWIPKFYYKVYVGTVYSKDWIDIKGASYFADTTAANAAGYALHRAFIDGGSEKNGFFFDKYECSKNAKGTGWVASSIANGDPVSTSSSHNPIGDLTATSGVNYYYSAITAPKARDGSNGAINSSSIFHCASRFQYAALAMLSSAHGQNSSVAAVNNAWYNSTSNFPKGNNDNALKDTNDTSVIYTTDGYSNCGKTGSGAPFSKTTHNGQPSGVCDLNGNMYEISIGVTCIAVSTNITGITQANPGVITAAGHGLVSGSYVQFASIGGMTQLNDKIFVVSWADTDTFTLYAANGTDSLDTSAFGAYTSGGTATRGVFYVAKETTAMKNFTSGTTLATDHWGATGCAAMMSSFAPAFETAYPNNGFAQRFGDSTGQVLSGDTSGAGWTLSGLGLPAAVSGISTSGTAAFGTDYFYQYIRNDLCLLAGGAWDGGSNAGVWSAFWYYSRSNSHAYVGFRAACYPE